MYPTKGVEEQPHGPSAQKPRTGGGRPGRQLLAVLAAQVLVGAVVTALAWLLGSRPIAAQSAAYGALAGIVPTVLAGNRMLRWAAPGASPVMALMGLLVWEVVRLVLVIGALLAAPRLMGKPSWLPLIIGLALTIKIYWVALLAAHSVESRRMKARKVLSNGC